MRPRGGHLPATLRSGRAKTCPPRRVALARCHHSSCRARCLNPAFAPCSFSPLQDSAVLPLPGALALARFRAPFCLVDPLCARPGETPGFCAHGVWHCPSSWELGCSVQPRPGPCSSRNQAVLPVARLRSDSFVSPASDAIRSESDTVLSCTASAICPSCIWIASPCTASAGAALAFFAACQPGFGLLLSPGDPSLSAAAVALAYQGLSCRVRARTESTP